MGILGKDRSDASLGVARVTSAQERGVSLVLTPECFELGGNVTDEDFAFFPDSDCEADNETGS